MQKLAPPKCVTKFNKFLKAIFTDLFGKVEPILCQFSTILANLHLFFCAVFGRGVLRKCWPLFGKETQEFLDRIMAGKLHLNMSCLKKQQKVTLILNSTSKVLDGEVFSELVFVLERFNVFEIPYGPPRPTERVPNPPSNQTLFPQK